MGDQDMSVAEIQYRIETLQRQKDQIQLNVSMAKRNAAAGKGFANIEWLASQEKAIRDRGRAIGHLQRMLGAQTRAEKERRKQESQRRLEWMFLEKARDILPADVFAQILREAKSGGAQ